MKPFYEESGIAIYHGDCLSVLRALPECSFDSCVTDPPYGLEFMGKEWDKLGGGFKEAQGNGEWAAAHGVGRKGFDGYGQLPNFVKPTKNRKCPDCGNYRDGRDPAKPNPRKGYRCVCGGAIREEKKDIARSMQEWHREWAAAVFRVLKPGAHLLAFGGTRTYHRLACAIEDAGFEIRDCIMWVYGSGFPKSHNLDKTGLFCGCKETAEREVRAVRNGDVSSAESAESRQGSVLLDGLPQPSVSIERRDAAGGGTEGLGELRMEGRDNTSESPRELRVGAVRPVSAGPVGHGAEGRLHNAASPDNGAMGQAATDAHGMRSPLGSRPTEQRAIESGTVAGQPLPQNGGAWPVCNRCGKQQIPSGYGTALKPSCEPIVVARKPLIGTVAENVATHRTGAMNIDGCRIEAANGDYDHEGNTKEFSDTSKVYGWAESQGKFKQSPPSDLGRWPANLIHDGSPEVLACFPDTASGQPAGVKAGGKLNCYGTFAGGVPVTGFGDAGSAARFFYCAKADPEDRNEGCDKIPQKVGGMVSNTSGQHMTRRDGGAPGPRGNHHPTVKPTDLMRYLIRLVTPPGGRVLDPFFGSGTTGKAAHQENFRCDGIEREAEYVEIAKARAEHERRRTPLFGDSA